MPAKQTLDSWVEMPATGKRKRTVAVDYTDDNSEKENVDAKTAPARKRQAKASTAAKTGTKSSTTAKPKKTDDAKGAKKLYADILKVIDKGVDALDKKVKKMNPNSRAITTSTYAAAAAKHMPAVSKLVPIDPTLAFNLLLSLADASHTDLDVTPKMCGEPGDQSTPTFKKLDAALLPLIASRETPKERMSELPSVPHRWTPKDADVGPFKTGWPNAQQRNQMERQRLEWEKDRKEKRRERRDECEDWVAVALSDLKQERDFLALYGVEGYLPLSIAKLEEYAY